MDSTRLNMRMRRTGRTCLCGDHVDCSCNTNTMTQLRVRRSILDDRQAVNDVSLDYDKGELTKKENPEKRNFQRLLSELHELDQDAPTGIFGSCRDENFYIWDISFPAPNGKYIKATLHFDSEYPFTLPTMFIKHVLFHPNISAEGKVCFQGWTPAYTIWSLIASVQVLLSDPNPNDPVNISAAAMFRENPEMYHRKALQFFELLESGSRLVFEGHLDHQINNIEFLEEELDLQRALEDSFNNLYVS